MGYSSCRVGELFQWNRTKRVTEPADLANARHALAVGGAHRIDELQPHLQLLGWQVPDHGIELIEIGHARRPGPEGMGKMLRLLVGDQAADCVGSHVGHERRSSGQDDATSHFKWCACRFR